MLLIIYILAWFLVAATAGVLYLTGSVNEISLTLFGFLAMTLVFMGIVAVLPWWVSQPYSPKR